MNQSRKPTDEITQLTEDEAYHLLTCGDCPPSNITSECECLYEYDPDIPGRDTLNKNNCCHYCLWVYHNKR